MQIRVRLPGEVEVDDRQLEGMLHASLALDTPFWNKPSVYGIIVESGPDLPKHQ